MVTPEQLAEARSTLGRQLATLREAAGLTQAQLARQAGYSRSAVANVETGRSSQPRTSWTRYDRLLRADGALLAGYDHYATLASRHRQQASEERERQRAARVERWRSPTATVTPPLADTSAERGRWPASAHMILQDAVSDREGPNTNRRDLFLTMLTAGFGTAGSWPLSEPAAPEPGLAGVADDRLLTSHLDVADVLAGMYRTADPRSVLSMAAAYADELLGLYDQQASGAPIELTMLVVGVHCQVGLWACHAGRTVSAYRFLSTGCAVAATARDRPLQARALGALSYLHSSAPRGGTGGNPRRALELLTQGLEAAARADGFTRGWLATWRADQHATLGNLRAALQDIETADAALNADNGGPDRGFFSRPHYGYGMREHLDSVRGLVHTLAGETDQAERTFKQVQTRAANNRRRVASFGHQGLGHTRRSDPEAACAALLRSVDLALADPYPMGLKRATSVRAGFNPRWATLACVRELDQRLRPLGATGR